MEETRRRLDEELKKEGTKLDIWGAGMGIEDVRAEVGAKAESGFQTFGDKWVGALPAVSFFTSLCVNRLTIKPKGELHHTKGEDPSIIAINGLHDVEEDIWSPKWGLKGKVDASVQVGINHHPTKAGSIVEENVAPLEIKTGRSVGVMAHRAQTMLYTLLMEDRYGKTLVREQQKLTCRGTCPSWPALLFPTRLHTTG